MEPLAGLTAAEVAGRTVVVLAVTAAFCLAYVFADVLLTLFAALVLGTAVRPALPWLQRGHLSRHLSAALLYAALITVVVALLVVVVPVASRQATGIATNFPRYVERARNDLMTSRSVALRRIALELPAAPETDAPAAAVPVGKSPAVVDTLQGLGLLSGYAFRLLAILALGFHWTYGGELTVRTLLQVVPLERREAVREVVEAAERKVGGYVRGQLIVCTVTATLSLLAFGAIGLDNALVLALVAGAMGAVPVVGGVLAGGIAVVAASSEPARVPWVIAAALAIHAVQEYVVAPRVMGKHVGVHPFTILLAISGFGSLLGIAGAVLAIPMAAILQLLLDRFVFDTAHELQPRPAPAERGRRGVLSLEARTLALDVRRQSRDAEGATDADLDQAKTLVESIANDIDRLLAAQPPAREPA